MECFNVTRNRSLVSSLQLSVKYSENKYERIIELKGLSGVKYKYINN
jgi:hypothetical protein